MATFYSPTKKERMEGRKKRKGKIIQGMLFIASPFFQKLAEYSCGIL